MRWCRLAVGLPEFPRRKMATLCDLPQSHTRTDNRPKMLIRNHRSMRATGTETRLLTEPILGIVSLDMPTRVQIRLHPPVRYRVSHPGLRLELPLILVTAKLSPSRPHGLLAPFIFKRAMLPNSPRPQQRLSPPLHYEMDEHEQHADISLSRYRLTEGMTCSLRKRSGPHHCDLLQE